MANCGAETREAMRSLFPGRDLRSMNRRGVQLAISQKKDLSPPRKISLLRWKGEMKDGAM
jgi:hypothetical protein